MNEIDTLKLLVTVSIILSVVSILNTLSILSLQQITGQITIGGDEVPKKLEPTLPLPSRGTNCDTDGDGYRAPLCGGNDCNDKNKNINPGMTEICGNDIDDNCDGTIAPLTCNAENFVEPDKTDYNTGEQVDVK